MNQAQINREMQAAREIQQGIMARAAEKAKGMVEKLRESPMAEWYGKAQEALKGPVADINRRVVEEPWFGKPVTDVLYNQQQPDTKANAKGGDMEQKPMDADMARFYNHQPPREPAKEQGMEP